MKTNRSDWSEERIKVLLSQLPKVEDNRSSKQIYQQVLMASGKKKKSVKWIGPAVATVVVFIYGVFNFSSFISAGCSRTA
ncbi:hypothetical protein BsIDN1_40270 [Bacillus safensis]|uniref:Uncharacterized protein n=1 Tax=Bacillus safensis TaxID=561879 RepID=A0A5S9MEV3_BACIA|nr:hypothetical protein BsIDN1_40270 [Bacillus safensis]